MNEAVMWSWDTAEQKQSYTPASTFGFGHAKPSQVSVSLSENEGWRIQPHNVVWRLKELMEDLLAVPVCHSQYLVKEAISVTTDGN